MIRIISSQQKGCGIVNCHGSRVFCFKDGAPGLPPTPQEVSPDEEIMVVSIPFNKVVLGRWGRWDGPMKIGSTQHLHECKVGLPGPNFGNILLMVQKSGDHHLIGSSSHYL